MPTISPRYRDICLDVFRFTYLTKHHLAHYFHSVNERDRDRVINRTLAAMERKRLIRRFAQPTFHGERGGRAPNVIALDEVGAHLVSDELGIERERISYTKSARAAEDRNYWLLLHTLEVADFGCAVRQAQADGVSWVGETELKRDPVRVRVQVPANGAKNGPTQEKDVSLISDGLYTVESQQKRAFFMLECDRGTTTINSQSPLQRRDIMQKIAAYHVFATAGLYKEAFQMGAPPRVTWVTTSDKRLQSLMQAVEDTIDDGRGRMMHWFTTKDQVTPASVLSQPIWQVAGQDEHLALIKEE